MKVVIINRSDTTGGAAIASHRLLHALLDAGVEANMLVIDKLQPDEAAVCTVGRKLHNKWNFLAERMGIALRTGMNRDILFKIDPGTHGLNLSRHPLVQDADVIVLAWVNQGMLSLEGIGKLCALGKPVVWVMHDMWNCTGVCHYAMQCNLYQGICASCPLLKSHGDSLATRTQRAKAMLYTSSHIHFVAVSHWLEACCRQSALMKDSEISVIYNAFPVNDYECFRLPSSDYGIDVDKKVVVMGARRLDVEVKGLRELIDATRYMAANRPELANRLHLLLFGDIANPKLLQELILPYTHLGTINDSARLNEIYRHADVVLSTAQYENLPTTLIEGLASGCLAVTYGNGGQADIVDHKQNGYIATFAHAHELADGLAWAIDAPVTRQQLHENVVQKFAASMIARQFIALFESLLAKFPR